MSEKEYIDLGKPDVSELRAGDVVTMSDNVTVILDGSNSNSRREAQITFTIPVRSAVSQHIAALQVKLTERNALIEKLQSENVTLKAQAEQSARQGARTTSSFGGDIRAAVIEDGTGWPCGLGSDCECPEHSVPPRPAGTYITIRLDNGAPVRFGRATLTYTNGEAE